MSESTNILIVGNGFDLSHYLPTKYDHFMDVMKNIEKFKGNEMTFDDLFKDCREPWFIEKTKEYYLTNNIKIESNTVQEIKELLKNNRWFKYFKKHVQEIKTWIDFEVKIGQALQDSSILSKVFEELKVEHKIRKYLSSSENNHLLGSLDSFSITMIQQENISVDFLIGASHSKGAYKDYQTINPQFCHGKNTKNGFSSTVFFNYLYKELEGFIQIFNLYLEMIIGHLQPKSILEILAKDWSYPDKIFSSNYTNTYQRFYDNVKIEYLHGSHGEDQNMVLSISELGEEILKKIKAYGFTKYHQKLFKDTDYLFLEEYKNHIINNEKAIERLENALKTEINLKAPKKEIDEYKKTINDHISKRKLNLNFFIWGHSLDESDKDYILDLFSLNDDIDRNVRVVVYYFDIHAKFSLLNNLLHILGKEKVEQWMKNKWLEFKPNPEIIFNSASEQGDENISA